MITGEKKGEQSQSINIEKLLRRASNDGFKDNIYQKKNGTFYKINRTYTPSHFPAV